MVMVLVPGVMAVTVVPPAMPVPETAAPITIPSTEWSGMLDAPLAAEAFVNVVPAVPLSPMIPEISPVPAALPFKVSVGLPTAVLVTLAVSLRSPAVADWVMVGPWKPLFMLITRLVVLLALPV